MSSADAQAIADAINAGGEIGEAALQALVDSIASATNIPTEVVSVSVTDAGLVINGIVSEEQVENLNTEFEDAAVSAQFAEDLQTELEENAGLEVEVLGAFVADPESNFVLLATMSSADAQAVSDGFNGDGFMGPEIAEGVEQAIEDAIADTVNIQTEVNSVSATPAGAVQGGGDAAGLKIQGTANEQQLKTLKSEFADPAVSAQFAEELQTELRQHAGLEVEVLDASFIDTSFGYAPAGGVPTVGAAASGFEVDKSSG